MADLRARQLDLARQSIVDACAELVTERHHLDFSMKEVAERAGVSLRTVYNHFAAREDLLDALGVVYDERMTALGGASTDDLVEPDDLLDAVRRNLAVFEQLGGISEAFAQMPLADIGRDEGRRERTELIAGFIAEQLPDAPDDEARAIGLVLRHLISHRSWFWLTREYGLTVEQLVPIVTWTITTLIRTANDGDLPWGPEGP